MGLRDDLIEAKLAAIKVDAKNAGATDEELNNISVSDSIETEVDLTVEAFVKFLTESNFTITQLKAPIKLEELKTPDQSVNVEMATLLGDKKPILDGVKKLGELIPGASAVIQSLVDKIESEIERAIKPLLEGGSTLPGLNLNKDDGALESTGYVFIGEDPESKEVFDVDDEDGQREHTTVKLIREDIEDLI